MTGASRRSAPGRRSLALAFVMVPIVYSSACFHRGPRNAPGIVDIERPPADITHEAVARPQDPGEQILMVAPGITIGGGGADGGDGRLAGAFVFGAEVSAEYHEQAKSGESEIMPSLSQLTPETPAVGLNVGGLATAGNSGVAAGPLFIEAMLRGRNSTTIAGGYAVHPVGGKSGAQLTLSFAGFYVRGGALVTGQFYLFAGVRLRAPLVRSWSR